MDNMYMLMSVEKKVGSDKLYLLQNKAENLDSGKIGYAIASAGMKDPLISLLLGVFLGGVGAHRFYLGDKKKGAAFASCFIISFLLIIGLAIALAVYTVSVGDGMLFDVNYRIITGLTIGELVSALLLCVVAVVGLIDGFMSYGKVQKRNFETLYNAFDKIEREQSESDF